MTLDEAEVWAEQAGERLEQLRTAQANVIVEKFLPVLEAAGILRLK